MNRRIALPLVLAVQAMAADIVVTHDASIVLDQNEPPPVRRAVADLASDFEKVFGRAAPTRSRPGARIVVALNHNLPPGIERPDAPESFRIVAKAPGTVVLTGSDTRGVIYAVYEFSRRYLGVDPLYFWTDHDPPLRNEIRIPGNTDIASGPPAFRYRGWFINDEDLLTGWKPGKSDGTGIALEVWDRIFEALLRLKGKGVSGLAAREYEQHSDTVNHFMRLFILCAALAVSAAAQHTLYLSGSITKDYVVGAKLPPSGLFALTPGGWQHRGYNMPFLYGIDASDPATLLLAAGNGLIRASDGGEHWTILTGSDVTELRDVAVDRNAKGTIYIAHSAGIRVTHDAGATWREIGSGLHRKYTEAIRVDPRRSNALVVGGEEGLFRTEDEGATWRFAGAAGYQILRIEVSPHDPCFWMAATQRGGLFASTDCGRTFESASAFGFGRNIYAIAFDATRPGRIAVAAWGPGVGVSEDSGKTWQVRNAGLPSTEVTAVAFDPDHPGRLYAALREEALYVSDDAGASWRKEGFNGAYITFLRFLPEARQ